MASVGADNKSDQFRMICLGCGRELLAQVQSVGREVTCPFCGVRMSVPQPREDGESTRASLPPLDHDPRTSFAFYCPRCQSCLEGHVSAAGQVGRCPTCNARFTIPQGHPNSSAVPYATLIETDAQNPTPVHAYAADGQQAPTIHRLANGGLQIECPRCGTRNDISADACAHCGAPFTLEARSQKASRFAATNDSLAIAALVFGIFSIPLCMLVFPAALALLFGVISWSRQGAGNPPGMALAGVILGVISLGLAILVYTAG